MLRPHLYLHGDGAEARAHDADIEATTKLQKSGAGVSAASLDGTWTPVTKRSVCRAELMSTPWRGR